MKQRVILTGIVNLYTGYGRHSIKIVEGLEKAGFEVCIRPIEISEGNADKKLPIPVSVRRNFVGRAQQDDWELLLCPPKHVPTPGKKTVYFTMWESTKLKPEAVGLLNRAEAVVVPCRWNQDNFIASGVARPVFIVPLGIDTTLFAPSPLPPGRKTIFGAAGRLAHGDMRKGLRDVITAFEKAFATSEDVELHIKGFADCSIGLPADKRIKVTERYLSELEYVKWLSGLHCFVSAARAEGWGWHQHEAMACGRPLIACEYGGLREFYDPTCGPTIPFVEEPAQEIWKNLGSWAQPDVWRVARLMKWAHAHRSALIEMGASAAKRAAQFSDEFATQSLINVMRTVGMVR